MAIDNNKQNRKQHLPKIVFNAVLAVGFAAATWFWVFGSVYPRFEEQRAAAEKAAAAYADLEQGNVGGFDGLSKLLGDRMPQYLSAKQSEALALVGPLKSPQGRFLKNLEEANEDIEKQKDDIAKQREILGNIVPTLTSESSDEAFERDIPNKMDLKRLVSYMEDQFYRGLGIKDGGSVGLDGIKYDPIDREPYKVGTFSMNITFKDAETMRGLLAMLAKTGVIPMRPEGGIDVSKAPSSSRVRGNVPAGYSALTNPLITVDQFSVSNYFDPAKRESKEAGAAGSVTVKFHLRTLNYDETQLLLTGLRSLINGSKEDPAAPAVAKSVPAFLAEAEAGVKSACAGIKRDQPTCPLNSLDFVKKMSELRDLSKSAAGLDGAVSNIVGKKGGKTEVETTAALSDAYRRVNAIDRRFKELRSDIQTTLGLK